MPPLPHNPIGIQVLGASTAGVFVDFIVIISRLWSRRLNKRKFAVGDYLIIAAWIFAFADLMRKIVAYKWGAGLHITQILATDPSHLLDEAKITYAGYFVWNACVCCIKLSILCVYLELFGIIVWFSRCVRAMMVVVITFFVGVTIALCLQCRPFAANYDSSVPGAKCGISKANGEILISSINITIDIILVLLPLPVVWNLQISRIKRAAVSAMFSLGMSILVVVGFRFKLIKEENYADFIHNGEVPGILNSLELYLGMISACLPFLSPPIVRIRTIIVDSSLISLLTHRYTSTNRTDNTATGNVSLEVLHPIDWSHEQLTSKDSYGKRIDRHIPETSVETWPPANIFGTTFQVFPENIQPSLSRTQMNGIEKTSEWDVRVGKQLV